MPQSDDFWRYAEAAMLGAHNSKNEAEKYALLDLARIVAQAALESEGAAWDLRSGHHDANAAYGAEPVGGEFAIALRLAPT